MNMNTPTSNQLTDAVNSTNRGKRKNMMRLQLNSQQNLVSLGSVSRRCAWRPGLLFTGMVLAGLTLASSVRSACNDGCNTGLGNTFLGDNALQNNTGGMNNTAVGASALLNDTGGFNNTATGV